MLKLSENLRRILNERDMTVASLSRLSGVPKTNIQGWLDGASPNVIQLFQVATVLNVNLEELAFSKRSFSLVDKALDQLELNTGTYEIRIRKIEK